MLTMYRKKLCNLVTINPRPIGEDEDRPITACLSSIRRAIAGSFPFATLSHPNDMFVEIHLVHLDRQHDLTPS